MQRDNALLLLLLLLAAVPLYYELGRNPVQLWDESRVAINAVEMSRSGHWLVPHFEGSPDHWNTKPPLLIWLEALSFTVFGYSTWALRLPVAVANLVTVIVVFRFGARAIQQPLAGFFGGLVLVTCAGFVRLHVARTGDYDALLVCWQTILWASFFQYLETGRRRSLVWLAGALIAATMTKGPASLMGLPGLALYALLRGKLGWLLRQRGIYVVVASWLVIVVGYYWGRDALLDPGYWTAVKYNDLGGRFLGEQGSQTAYWSYYLSNIREQYFNTWLWALLPAVGLLMFQPQIVRQAAGMLLAFVASWLLVVSSASSQLAWYDAPIYPPLALLAGIGLALLYRDFLQIYLPRLSRWQGWGLRAVAVVGLLWVPYRAVLQQFIVERDSEYGVGPDSHLGRYVTTLTREQPQLDTLAMLYQGGYNAVLSFYKFAYDQQPGKQLESVSGKSVRAIHPGMVVVVCNPEYRARIDSAFQVAELHTDGHCQTLIVQQAKK